MYSLVRYDRSTGGLFCQNESNIPSFCKKCLLDSNKKCRQYYDRLLKEESIGIHECPYGMQSYYIRNTIYTSIIIKNSRYGQAKRNIENYNQKITDFMSFTFDQIKGIITDYEDLESTNIMLSDCIHDLRNIGSYFNALTEKIGGDYALLVENDDNIKALLLLYDIVNYRLDALEGISSANNRREVKKIHPQIRKLAILVSFQAKNKDIRINIDQDQENFVYLSRNIYLALFLLLENAVKHSPFNSCIDIDFEETTEYTKVMICNKGPHISEDELPRLVERGYRGINALSKGSGLGLTLAKSILDDNNSDFKINAIHINPQESLFKVTFKFYTTKNK